MDIWLIQTGEQMPLEGNRRLFRTGLLAGYLADRGHRVTWWASDFDHQTKRHLARGAGDVDLPSGIRLRLLHSPAYRSNLGLGRVVSHAVLARQFRGAAARAPRPDVILCSLPTLDLARAAVDVGGAWGVPVYLDIRDLWPDAIAQVFPPAMRRIAGEAAEVYFHHTGRTLRRATGLIGISDGYLAWGLRRAGRPRSARDEVFPIGYERPTFPAEAKADAGERLQEMGVAPRGPICWFAGTFGMTYDLETVIRAAAQLEARGSHVQFVLSGDGPRGRAWRQAAQGIGNVVFTGMVDGPSIAWMLENAQMGLAAYSQGAPQGLPNKVFEYMSGGLAVASSLEGEFRALLQEHDFGVSYPPGDAASLAASIEGMVKDPPLLATRRSNARRLFQERFDARLIYPRMCAFLERVAEEGASGLPTMPLRGRT